MPSETEVAMVAKCSSNNSCFQIFLLRQKVLHKVKQIIVSNQRKRQQKANLYLGIKCLCCVDKH